MEMLLATDTAFILSLNKLYNTNCWWWSMLHKVQR